MSYPDIKSFLSECDAYRALRVEKGASTWKETTLSQYLLGHARHIGELRGGRDIGYQILCDARADLREWTAAL